MAHCSVEFVRTTLCVPLGVYGSGQTAVRRKFPESATDLAAFPQQPLLYFPFALARSALIQEGIGSVDRDTEYYVGLVRELCRLPNEVEWVEFKENNADPQQIGEYISALANAAALNGKVSAYLLWGIRDGTHDIVGTEFHPAAAKKGNEPLETWLLRLLTPKHEFRFHEVVSDGQLVVLLEIARAVRHPVSFSGMEYIRIGQVKKPLKEAPELERQLWRVFDRTPFEDMIAAEHLSADEALQLLDSTA